MPVLRVARSPKRMHRVGGGVGGWVAMAYWICSEIRETVRHSQTPTHLFPLDVKVGNFMQSQILFLKRTHPIHA